MRVLLCAWLVAGWVLGLGPCTTFHSDIQDVALAQLLDDPQASAPPLSTAGVCLLFARAEPTAILAVPGALRAHIPGLCACVSAAAISAASDHMELETGLDLLMNEEEIGRVMEAREKVVEAAEARHAKLLGKHVLLVGAGCSQRGGGPGQAWPGLPLGPPARFPLIGIHPCQNGGIQKLTTCDRSMRVASPTSWTLQAVLGSRPGGMCSTGLASPDTRRHASLEA